jgi:hypothetical protein
MLVERLMSITAELCLDVFFEPVSRDVSLLWPEVAGKALNKFLVGLELSSEPMARFFLVRFVAGEVACFATAAARVNSIMIKSKMRWWTENFIPFERFAF